MLAQGQSSSAKRGGLAADVSSGLIFLKKKKEDTTYQNKFKNNKNQHKPIQLYWYIKISLQNFRFQPWHRKSLEIIISIFTTNQSWTNQVRVEKSVLVKAIQWGGLGRSNWKAAGLGGMHIACEQGWPELGKSWTGGWRRGTESFPTTLCRKLNFHACEQVGCGKGSYPMSLVRETFVIAYGQSWRITHSVLTRRHTLQLFLSNVWRGVVIPWTFKDNKGKLWTPLFPQIW